MYKYIIFDIGGVMVDFSPRDYLMERFGRAAVEDLVYSITFGSDTWKQLDAGLITRAEANYLMLEKARRAGCEFEVQEVLDNWTTLLHPRRRMVDVVRRLHNHGYRVLYLSNIPEDTLRLLMDRELGGIFDGGLASYEVHINKPDPRIYQALLKRYRLNPKMCIFIDDNIANVRTAFELGMTGVPMQGSVGTLIRSLRACNVSLRDAPKTKSRATPYAPKK